MLTTAMFVLGMHRSGTSAASRFLNLFGVDLGRIPFRVTEENAKGFWEHPAAVAINEAVLASLDSRWDDPGPLPAEWWSAAPMEPYRQAIRRLVASEFAAAPLFGMKDPRLCRLVPLWLAALSDVAITPAFVIVLRHPSEVAASIWKRNRLPLPVSEALWLTHMLEAERYTRRHPRVFVSYEDLLADWRGQARRMATALGLSWPRSEDEAEPGVIPFLDPSLRHFTARAIERRPGVSRWVSEAYALLLAAARDETTEIRHRLASLDDAFAAAQATFGPALAGEQTRAGRAKRVAAGAGAERVAVDIRSLESRLAEQAAWAQVSAAEVVRRDEVIRTIQASLDAEVEKRDQVIRTLQASLETEVEKRDQMIRTLQASRETEVEKRDEVIRTLQALLEEQVRWARDSAANVGKRDAIIAKLQASVEEQTRWAQHSNAEVARRDAVITELQAAVHDAGRAARASAAEVSRRGALIADLERTNRALRAALDERAGPARARRG